MTHRFIPVERVIIILRTAKMIGFKTCYWLIIKEANIYMLYFVFANLLL